MFRTRVISSVVLVILALVTILGGGYLLAATLLFLALVAYRELMKACKLSGEGKKLSALEINGYIGILAYYLVMVFVPDRIYLFLAVVLILIGFMFIYVFSFPKYHSDQIMSAFFLCSLCAGDAVLYLSCKRASLWRLYGVDDFHQLMDL